jgi:hypothetical protein
MGLLKARLDGSWVDTAQAGKARVAGSWVDFGPSGFPEETLFETGTPANTASDGIPLSQGVRFTPQVNGQVLGARYWCGPTPPTSAKAGLFLNSDHSSMRTATYASMSASSGWNEVRYATPVSVVAGEQYMTVNWTQDRYPYTSSASWPYSNSSGNLIADGAFFDGSADISYPDNSSSLNFWCDVIFQEGEAPIPSHESLDWGDTPAVPDGVDGSSYYALGAQFNLSTGFHRDCLGIEWNPAPTNTPNPGSPTVSHSAMLFRVSDGARLAYKEFTPVPGVKNEIFFDSSVPLLGFGEEEYVAVIYTHHYVFRTPPGGAGTWEVLSPSGMIHHTTSRLYDTPTPPTTLSVSFGTFNAWYFVSPIVAL